MSNEFWNEDPAETADTKPKPPAGLRDASLEERLAAEEPPASSLHDTAEWLALAGRGPGRPLLLMVVMAGTACLCLMLIGFAGVAGYRDGLATNDVKITQTLATGIAEQYALGVSDLTNDNPELAEARFSYIVETIQPAPPYLLDSPQQLALARSRLAATPTPQATATLPPNPSPTAAPSVTSAPAATTVPQDQDPEYLYTQADLAMRVMHYEDAITWLEALRALAPDYRAAETTAMYLEALTQQGKMYLRGQNPDGEDMLARGVVLIYTAHDLAPAEVSELYGEAIFVENYLNARSYVNGGNYAAALPILEDLCNANCGWSYHGLSVEDLLNQAREGSGGS